MKACYCIALYTGIKQTTDIAQQQGSRQKTATTFYVMQQQMTVSTRNQRGEDELKDFKSSFSVASRPLKEEK